MNLDVTIERTDLANDSTTVYYSIKGLNISGNMKLLNTDFQKAVGDGGYTALGTYILQKLYDQLGNALDGDK